MRFAVLGITAAVLLAAVATSAQAQVYLYVADEQSDRVFRYNADGTSAQGGSTGWPVVSDGAESLEHYRQWLFVTNHVGANRGLSVFNQLNPAESRLLLNYTNAAGTAFDAVNRILYVADETEDTISRIKLSGLHTGNINDVTATVLNTATFDAAHDVLFHNGELYAVAGASSYKGVRKYSADLSTVTEFISSASASSQGYVGRPGSIEASPDGTTFFLSHARLGAGDAATNFIGRWNASGNFLNKIDNPIAGPNTSQLWGVFGMEFWDGDLYATPYASQNPGTAARVTKLDFNEGGNYQTDAPVLSAHVSNTSLQRGGKYPHFVNFAAFAPEPGSFALLGLGMIGGALISPPQNQIVISDSPL